MTYSHLSCHSRQGTNHECTTNTHKIENQRNFLTEKFMRFDISSRAKYRTTQEKFSEDQLGLMLSRDSDKKLTRNAAMKYSLFFMPLLHNVRTLNL